MLAPALLAPASVAACVHSCLSLVIWDLDGDNSECRESYFMTSINLGKPNSKQSPNMCVRVLL